MEKYLGITIFTIIFIGILAGCEYDWQAATCTAPLTCSICGEIFGEPLGHTWKDANCAHDMCYIW